MSAGLLAALLLSVGAYLHTLSRDPSMRPESPYADAAWRALAFMALFTWGALIVRGFLHAHWSNAMAALLGSIALNWYFGHLRGPKPSWPGLSMFFSVVGLVLAAWSFANE